MTNGLSEVQLPLIFLSGLMGSAHCVGMCGPFTVMIASAKGGRNFARQASYSVGRLFTYAWLGAIAGFAGQQVQAQSFTSINPAAVLAAIAGVFLVYEGGKTVGILPRSGLFLKSSATGCGALKIMRATLHSPQLSGAFFGGMLTSLLPCGLVYAMLLSAANTGDLVSGSGLMVAFGLGTVPLMLALGVSLGRLSVARRQVMFRLAGVAMIALGGMSLVRAWHFWHLGTGHSCPLCH